MFCTKKVLTFNPTAHKQCNATIMVHDLYDKKVHDSAILCKEIKLAQNSLCIIQMKTM
ncbi:hypothetical protein BN1184_CA_00220 [Pantoea ananatis]|nr:hypothetical protein BN1183_CP_00210 [Pantoea ananatis]CRH40509.1 hypothetical protein BN1184_CA_00220 [Pantoea ananatis]